MASVHPIIQTTDNPLAYNGKTYYFGLYNHETKKYSIMERPFIVSRSQDNNKYLMGQFLSTSWFNHSVSVESDITFLVVSSESCEAVLEPSRIVSIIQNQDCFKLAHIVKYTVTSRDMKAYYSQLMSSSSNLGLSERSLKLSLFGCDTKNTYLQITARPLILDNNSDCKPRIAFTLPEFTALV